VAFYANNILVEVTPWDFRLSVGEIEKVEAAPEGRTIGKFYVEDKARITMSPEHTKALLKLLQDNVAQFEAKVGPIPTGPPETS
jgi:hypothetical protein